MDYQLTNFIVILHRATRVTRYRGAKLKIERREGERERETERRRELYVQAFYLRGVRIRFGS